jgi:hypothetical protein
MSFIVNEVLLDITTTEACSLSLWERVGVRG